MFRLYADLTKLGIVVFVMLAGMAGYALSYPVESVFRWWELLSFIGGLYFLSSGSLILNQVQEYQKDRLMPRTAKRPVASGQVKPAAAGILALTYLIIGLNLLLQASVLSGLLGLLTLVLYNGFYVYWWKPKWIFAAIPGAIPGALPVTIGYAINKNQIWHADSVYLFLVLFFWQMPHFWALAIKFHQDYDKAGFPVLPTALGMERTLYHMGLWTFLYVGSAVAAPFFVQVGWVYLALMIPFSFKVMQEFVRFFKSRGTQRWLQYFLWVNFSVLAYLYIPVLDKWSFLLLKSN